MRHIRHSIEPSTIDALPLAITRAGPVWGCVGAVTESGDWLRPEPIAAAHLEGRATPFRHDQWTRMKLGPSREYDARPEDRELFAEAFPPQALGRVSGLERLRLLERHCDPSVESIFATNRSLGLIQARLRRVYVKRSIGRRLFVRAEFRDARRDLYDWIVPALEIVRFVKPDAEAEELSATNADRLTTVLGSRVVFLALGLTKANHRFPGQFGGCHPLVVGVHTEPDYRGDVGAAVV